MWRKWSNDSPKLWEKWNHYSPTLWDKWNQYLPTLWGKLNHYSPTFLRKRSHESPTLWRKSRFTQVVEKAKSLFIHVVRQVKSLFTQVVRKMKSLFTHVVEKVKSRVTQLMETESLITHTVKTVKIAHALKKVESRGTQEWRQARHDSPTLWYSNVARLHILGWRLYFRRAANLLDEFTCTSNKHCISNRHVQTFQDQYLESATWRTVIIF